MKKVLLLAAIAVISTSAIAQKVSNKLGFQKGQKFEIVSTVNVVNTMEMMGQSMDMKMNVSTTRMLDVEDVKNNQATIESKIKRVQYTVDAMGNTQTFDSENEADMKGEGGKMAEKALKNKYSMVVDATGKVLSVKADDDNPNASEKQEGKEMADAMQQLMTGFELPKAGDKMEFSILPAQDVSKGFTWTDNTTPNKDEKRNAKFTVTDINDQEIIIDFTEEISGKVVQEQMGMEINIDKKDKSTGKIILDRKTGLMKQQNVSTKSEAIADMMGQTMPINSTITKTIVVKSS